MKNEEQIKRNVQRIVKQRIIIYTPTFESNFCKSHLIFTFDLKMGVSNLFAQFFLSNTHMFRKVFLSHNIKQYPNANIYHGFRVNFFNIIPSLCLAFIY
jgi:hypothetical protein